MVVSSTNGGKERSDAMEEKVYKCTKALLIDHEKGFTEIPVDSTWMFMGGSEGHDVALEDNDNEDSATQIYISYFILDEHFEEIVN